MFVWSCDNQPKLKFNFLTRCKLSLVLVHHFQRRPSAGNAVLLPVSSHEGNEHDETNGSGADTEVESEEEWLSSPQLVELNRRFPSRMSEAMAIEVHL